MATKTYKSTTEIYFNVRLKSGNCMHIGFSPISGGGSMFITSDEELQEALEKHRGFNTMFRLDSVQDESAKEETNEEDAPDGDDEQKLMVVNVSCIEDARDYLAEKFAISRSKIKNLASINAKAKENGVKFSGI